MQRGDGAAATVSLLPMTIDNLKIHCANFHFLSCWWDRQKNYFNLNRRCVTLDDDMDMITSQVNWEECGGVLWYRLNKLQHQMMHMHQNYFSWNILFWYQGDADITIPSDVPTGRREVSGLKDQSISNNCLNRVILQFNFYSKLLMILYWISVTCWQ